MYNSRQRLVYMDWVWLMLLQNNPNATTLRPHPNKFINIKCYISSAKTEHKFDNFLFILFLVSCVLNVDSNLTGRICQWTELDEKIKGPSGVWDSLWSWHLKAPWGWIKTSIIPIPGFCTAQVSPKQLQ